LVAEDPIDDHGEGTIHFRQKIYLKPLDYNPITPPYTPGEVKVQEGNVVIEHPLQVQQTEDKSMETIQSVVEHHQPAVHYSSWIIFSIIATAMAAVILGNGMRLQHRVDQINFEHEKRISELELENNILKNEMNKLRHLYTRSELDEQVQRAEFEWIEAHSGTDNANEAFDDTNRFPEPPEQQPVRKVPPQDSGVKRKVVWSGDEEEPMLIADKDYVLPAFCYKQDQAVQDDLFFEYSAKYCDVKKRKIEAKQKKAELQAKRQPKKENYNKFIHPTPSETVQDSSTFDPSKPASPFNIDYKKAFDAIKSEGSVIVEALGNILDLSPEPDAIFERKVTDSIPKEEEQELSVEQVENHPREQDFSKLKEGLNPKQNHRTQELRQNERSVRDNSRKQGDELKYRNKKQVHQGEWKENKGQVQFDDIRKRQYSNEDTDDDNGKKDSQIQGKDYDDSDDDSDDDHYKQNFGARDKGKPQEHKKRRQDHRELGSGEQQQWNHSGENSYLEQYKRDGWRDTKDQDIVRDGKRHNDPKTYHEQEKQGEWHDRRYKGREEYRQFADQKQGEWHDKRYKGREDHRQKNEQKQGEWHDKRYKGREEHRQKGEQKQSEWHDKRYKGREEYRQNAGKQGERKGSEERKWH
uniref:Uncharacterized protein n=1 Tax=Anopheles atroparvus TaxID=41427 RepID=A0A182ILU9_ANOAO